MGVGWFWICMFCKVGIDVDCVVVVVDGWVEIVFWLVM